MWYAKSFLHHKVFYLLIMSGTIHAMNNGHPQPAKKPSLPKLPSFEELPSFPLPLETGSHNPQAALCKAIIDGDFETFKRLILKENIDPNFCYKYPRDKTIVIPIFAVLASSQHEQLFSPSKERAVRRLLMLKLLLQNGADPNVLNKEKEYPLDRANLEEVTILVQHGAVGK